MKDIKIKIQNSLSYIIKNNIKHIFKIHKNKKLTNKKYVLTNNNKGQKDNDCIE